LLHIFGLFLGTATKSYGFLAVDTLTDFREDSAALSLAYASVGDDGCTAIARYMRENARKSQHLLKLRVRCYFGDWIFYE